MVERGINGNIRELGSNDGGRLREMVVGALGLSEVMAMGALTAVSVVFEQWRCLVGVKGLPLCLL